MSKGIGRRTGGRIAVVVLALTVCSAAGAAWNDECRVLAQRLSTEPGALKTGELDILKSCLSDLQRSLVLGETIPSTAASLPPASCPPPPTPVCPVCAACAVPEKEEAAAMPAAPKSKPKPRNREDDRRLKPYLPQY